MPGTAAEGLCGFLAVVRQPQLHSESRRLGRADNGTLFHFSKHIRVFHLRLPVTDINGKARKRLQVF